MTFNFVSDLNPLNFIGLKTQEVNVCNDLPINSQIITLTVFDSSLSAKPVCFQVEENEFFKLINDNNNTNGLVVLAKKFDRKNAKPAYSFKAFAYFCDRPYQNITQTISVRILKVNQYAPKVKIPVC